jgi:hypothetical protein
VPVSLVIVALFAAAVPVGCGSEDTGPPAGTAPEAKAANNAMEDYMKAQKTAKKK